MKKSALLIIFLLLFSGLSSAQTRWMRLHPDVSWKYLKQWEKKHTWLTPSREGRGLFQKGNLSEARGRLEKALSQGSEDGRLFYELGYCYQAEGADEKAADLFHRAINKLSQQSPDHLYCFNSNYLLGTIYEKQGRTKEALTHYEKALELRPATPEIHYRKAFILRKLGDCRASISEIRETLTLDPAPAPANYLLGLLYLENEELKPARKFFEKAIALNVEVASSLYCLGHISAREKKLDEAIAYYRQSLENNPEDIYSHVALGNIFYEQENLPAARKHFTRLSSLDPSSPRWHYNLGVICRQMGDDDLAREEFSKAESLDPNLAFISSPIEGLEGLSAEAARLYAAGKLKESVDMYRQALLEDPFYLPARYNLAVSYTGLGENSKARRQYSRLIRIEPDYAPAHLNRGILAYQENRGSPEAAHHLRRYLELEPESNQADLIKRYLHEIRGW